MGKFYNPLSGDSGDDIRPMSIRQILGSKSDLMGPLSGQQEEEYEEDEEEVEPSSGKFDIENQEKFLGLIKRGFVDRGLRWVSRK